MAYTTSQLAGGVIPQDDGYMPGDSAYGNPVRQLGSVNRSAVFGRTGPATGTHLPLPGLLLIAGLIACMEWRRVKRAAHGGF